MGRGSGHVLTVQSRMLVFLNIVEDRVPLTANRRIGSPRGA